MGKKQRQRKRGMGSIFKHGSSWWIAFYNHGKQVKERVGPIGLVTKGQAEQALKARMGEIVQGKFSLEKFRKTISLGKLAEKYLQWIQENQKGFKREEIATKLFLGFIGDKGISEITSWYIEQYKSQRKQDGIKPSTINRELTVLRSMFNRAIDWEDAITNPVKGVKKAKPLKADEYEREPKYIPAEVFDKISSAAYPNLRAFITVARHTGMRAGEILKLLWEDINFEREQIYIRDTKNFTQRIVPINAEVRETLSSLPRDNNRVFKYMNKDTVGNTWRKALKRARISGYRVHDMRHSFITDLVTKGVDPYTVMEITGHKDTRMLKRYSHPTEEHKRNAVKLLESAPNNPTTITEGAEVVKIHKNLEGL